MVIWLYLHIHDGIMTVYAIPLAFTSSFQFFGAMPNFITWFWYNLSKLKKNQGGVSSVIGEKGSKNPSLVPRYFKTLVCVWIMKIPPPPQKNIFLRTIWTKYKLTLPLAKVRQMTDAWKSKKWTKIAWENNYGNIFGEYFFWSRLGILKLVIYLGK